MANVPASLFVPPPKVDSAVLKLKVLDKPSVEVKDEGVFFRVVKAAFSQRRKLFLIVFRQIFLFRKMKYQHFLKV